MFFKLFSTYERYNIVINIFINFSLSYKQCHNVALINIRPEDQQSTQVLKKKMSQLMSSWTSQFKTVLRHMF